MFEVFLFWFGAFCGYFVVCFGGFFVVWLGLVVAFGGRGFVVFFRSMLIHWFLLSLSTITSGDVFSLNSYPTVTFSLVMGI